MVKAIPHNSKCRYGERGAADAKRAFYTTGDYARADERLLTLCTCTYEMSDARLLIMARPLRDGETLTADEVTVNPDPLLPARWPAGA